MSISEVTYSIYKSSLLSTEEYDHSAIVPPFIILACSLHLLDYQHRKFLLDCARIQKRINKNQFLGSSFKVLRPLKLVGKYEDPFPVDNEHMKVELLSLGYTL